MPPATRPRQLCRGRICRDGHSLASPWRYTEKLSVTTVIDRFVDLVISSFLSVFFPSSGEAEVNAIA
jgi:hypothetical protein